MSKKLNAVWARTIIILFATLGLTTCDVFKAGLGTKIDVSDPTVDVNSISNGAYLRGTVTLRGSASDDVDVKSVTLIVSVNSAKKASLPAKVNNNKWSVALNTAASIYGSEVQADLDIRVVDGSGKSSDRKIVAYFDNKKPVITSMTPTADSLGSSDYAISDRETISGSVQDGFGVAKVELVTGSGSDAIAYSDTTDAATWSIEFNAANYLNTAELGTAPNYGAIKGATYVSAGLYRVPYTVRATDLAGNVSDAVSGNLYISPDGAPIVDISGQTPSIDLTVTLYPNAPDLGDIDHWKSSSLSPGATIKARVFDMDGLDTSAAGTYFLLVPGSSAALVPATGSLDIAALAPYTYTLSGLTAGGLPCNVLSQTILMKTVLSDGTTSIPQKADFGFTLPSVITAPGGSMPELGEYMLLLHSSDYAANKILNTSSSRNLPAKAVNDWKFLSVYITQGTPAVSVSTPSNGGFLSNLAATGTIDDAFGPLSVIVAVDGAAAGNATLSGSGTSQGWSYSYSGPALSDGLHSAAFTGKNLAGKTGNAVIIQFNVDNTGPIASVQSVSPATAAGTTMAFSDSGSTAPGGILNAANGWTRFKGLASDTAALASASWKVQHVTNSSTWALDPTAVDSGSFAPASMSLWTLDLDTTTLVDGDYYVLSVTATDKAGNVGAAAQRTFRVLQSSDLPTFTLTNMTASATTSADAKDNLLTTNIRLDATVSDDDRVDPAMVKILIDPLSGGLPSPSGSSVYTAGDTSVTGSVNSTTGNLSFSYSFTATGAGTGTALLAEGRHFFYLVANDDSSYKNGKGSVASTIGPVWFAVDTHQPQIAFDQAGGIYVSSSQAITGTVSSANALDPTSPFTIQPQGGSLSSPALSPTYSSAGSHTWSYNLDVSSLSDGALLVSANAKDEFGLSSVSSFSVTVDKTAPTMAISNPAQVFSDVNGLSLVGTAMDLTSGVASMTAAVSVDSSGSHGADATAQTALTLNATTGTPNTSGSWSLDLSALATGSYFVALRVTDKAGNHYDEPEFVVSVDKDLPAATIDNVLSAAVNGATYNAASAVPDSWSGTGNDSFFQKTQVFIDGVQVGSDIVVAGAWTVSRTWASIADGSHTISVKVSDRGGHATTTAATFVKDTVAPTLAITAPESASWLSATPYTIRGSADDGSGTGVSLVYYIAGNAVPDHGADASATVLSTWTLASGGASWNASINLATLGEGAKRLWVKSADHAGNWNASASSVDFNVDLAPPRATETNYGAAVIQSRTDIVFAGKADDAAITALRAATSVLLSYSKDGGAATVVDLTASVDLDGADNVAGNADDGSWTWTLKADPNANGDHSADGLYVITLTVVDAAGKTVAVTRTAQIDTTAPLLAITAPAAGEATAVATYDISGTARDTGGVGFDGTNDVEYNMNGTGWHAMNSLVATINWAQAGVSLGAGEGAKTLQVRATDKLGNQSSASVSFYYDLAPPTLAETTVGTTDTRYIKADLAFGGKASDSNALSNLQVSVNGVTQVPDISVDADGPDDIAGNADDNSWTWTFPIASKADGTYALVFTAKDIANKTTTLARTVVLDTAAPTVSGIPSLAGWKTLASQNLAGAAADATSGIDRVEYRVDSGSWNNLTGTTSFSGSVAFPEGSSTLQIRAVDKAGNYSLVEAVTNSQQTVQVDLSDPTATITSPPTNPVLNGASDLSLTVTVTDAATGSGLASASVYAYDIPGSTAKALHSTATSGTSQSLTLTVPAADLFSLSGGNPGTVHKVCVVATDLAGRSSAVASLNFTLDKKLPSVVFSSHADGAEVNRLVTLSGTSSDENGLSSCVVQVHNRATNSWDAAPTGTASGSTAWSLADFDTTAFSTIDGAYDDILSDSKSQLRLRALATDAAGNQASVERVLVVDQNSDRPVIRLTNLATLDGTSKLKMSRVVYGTISDDDGYSIGEGASEKKLKLDVSEVSDFSVYASVTIDGGNWSYTASAGDGVKYLYFRATDAKEKVFTTDTGPTESLDEPRIWQSSAPPYWHDRVTFKVDTVPPKIADTAPILIDRTGPDFADFDGSVQLVNNMAFGGATPQFAVRVLASDENGIDTVKVTVPGAPGSPFTAIPMGADSGQPSYTRFETGPINVATATDGAVSLTVDVTDNSELTTSTNRTILIDNTPPTLTFINPLSPAAVINGSQDITGSASDSGSGLSTVTYGLGIDYSNGGDPAIGGTKFLWTIPFADSVAYHAGTESFHDTYTGSDIYVLPIVVRAEDAAGNVRQTAPMSLAGVARGSATTLQSDALKAEPYKSLVKVGQAILVGANARLITAYSSAAGTIDWAGAVSTSETSITIYEYCLRINPNADLPTAAMSYPTSGTTMGGNVRMYGTAIDDDGIKEVWMEIDTNGDGFFNAADDAIGGWYNTDQGKKVDGSANWSQTINESHEFDPAGSDPKQINVRVRAKDIYDTWGPWSTPSLVLIDKNVPQFGSAQAFYLEKEGDPSTTITYTPGMIVKGDWILRGSIEDDGAITAITISGAVTGSYVRDSVADPFDDVTHAAAPDADKYKRVDLAVPLKTSLLGGYGTLTFTLTAVDNAQPVAHETIQSLRILYDNQTPTASLLSPTTDSAIVVQSNGWYKIKGRTEDSGSDINRVEVYFIRRGNGTTTFDRIYNPASSNSSALLSTISIDANGSPLKAGTADSYTTTSLTDDALQGNALIHAGQKVLIGSELRTVSAYNSGSGRIDWNDGAISSAITSYAIRLAIQVDNKSTEVRDSGTGLLTTDDGDGYLEYLKQDAGNAYTWYVDIDSLNIPDGPIEIHYVSYDMAGNAVHQATPTKPAAGYYMVKNNGPRVASIELGTDIDGNTTFEAGEKKQFDYASDTASTETITAAFKVKSKMFLKPIVTNGNGDLIIDIAAGGYSATGLAFRTGASTPGIELSDANLITAGQGSRTFTLTIWDSTEETTRGTDSQKIERGVTCTIANVDATAPRAIVRPLYWNGASSNSLFGNSTANGHVDIASNATNGTGDADVSGKVSFRGTAFDETRIVNVYAYIGNGTNDTGAFAFTGVANTRNDGSRTYYRLAYFDGAWHGSGDASLTNGWQFLVPDDAIDQSGHRIAWQLDWNSALVSGGAATDRVVRILVEDKAGNANSGSADVLTGAGTRTVTTLTAVALQSKAIAVGDPVVLRNGTEEAYFTRVKAYDSVNGIVTLLSDSVPTDKASYTIYFDDGDDPSLQVDVVPYVTDISRKLPFVNRVPDVASPNPLYGKKGYFPVYQGQSGIEISGFNLPYAGAATIAGNGTVAVGATTFGTSAPDVTAADSNRTKVTVTIPSALQTGAVAVTTNGVASINNQNTGAPEYNQESGGIFTDDRYLYIDQTLPTISIAPFGRRFNAASQDSGKTLSAVASYNENISMSGSNRQGHVEYAEYSNYSAISAVIAPATDKLAATAHGLVTGQIVQLKATTAPTLASAAAVDPATQYYAIRLDADDFMLASSMDSALTGTVGSSTATSITDTALIGKTQLSSGTWKIVLPTMDVKTITSFNETTGAVGWSGGLGAQSGAYAILPSADLVDFATAGTAVAVADPDVSGEVILRGKAYDDQRIASITATISGPSGETFQGDADGGAFTIYSSTTDGSGNLTGTFVDAYAAYGWKMELEESGTEYKLSDARIASGHVFNWKFTWNSAKISTVAAANMRIAFTIKDYNGVSQSRAISQGVDVVPYISGIARSGLTTNRGRYGAYTVQQAETSLALSGFNLRRSGTGDSVRVARSGTGGTGTNLTATAGGADPYTSLAVTAGSNSGWLSATTNSVASINNLNDNARAYNAESDSNSYTANWTDDRYLRIWQVNQTFGGSTGAAYASMTQDTVNGVLVAAWVAESANSVYYNTQVGTTTPITAFHIYDPQKFTDVNMYPGESLLALGMLANYQGGAWGTAPTIDVAGGLAVYTSNITNFVPATNATATAIPTQRDWDGSGATYNNNAYPIEALNNDQQMSQFEEPRVARYNSGTVGTNADDWIHVAYFDKYTNAVKVSSFQDTNAVNLAQPKGWIVLDGSSDGQDTAGTAGWGKGVVANGVASVNNAGYTPNYESVSIDVDEAGIPAVLYYDNVNRTLRLARCNSNAPAGIANWTRQDVFKADDPYKSYAGQHVMMKFDPVGNLHVVFFRNGYPYYLYAPNVDATTTAYSFDYAVRIDDMGSLASIGEWPDITMDGAMPAVSYLTASVGSMDGLKYAAPKHQKAAVSSSFTTSVTSVDLIGNASFAAGDLITFPGNTAANMVRTVTAYDSATGTVSFAALASAPTNGTKFIVYKPGTWDYEVVPASANVQKDRTNIEVRKAGTDWGDTAISYRANRIELVYLKEEQ